MIVLGAFSCTFIFQAADILAKEGIRAEVVSFCSFSTV
jgi:hypothetical protein